MPVTCHRCNTTDEFNTYQNGPHVEARCIHCGYYIKFLSAAERQTLNAARSDIRVDDHMSQLLGLSICMEDLFGDKIATGSNGKKYVCITDLPESTPWAVGKTNSKHYVSVDAWVNDEPDQYKQDGSLSLNQTKADREAKTKKVYIGNLRKVTGSQAPATTTAAAAPKPSAGDLPF